MCPTDREVYPDLSLAWLDYALTVFDFLAAAD
jgi:hypothetical protein